MTRFPALGLAITVMAGNGAALHAGSGVGGPTLLGTLQTAFSRWDADADGLLSRREIDTVVADPDIRGAEAAAAAVLKVARRKAGLDGSPVLRERLLEDLPSDLDCERAFHAFRDRIRKSRRVLFYGSPARIPLRQGALSDCFLMAGLGAIVMRDPEAPRRMIREKNDGGYVVDFPGTDPVDVRAPTDAEIAMGAVEESGAIWPVVLELACGRAKVRARADDAVEGPGALDAIAGGGSAASAIRLLTGRRALVVDLRDKTEGDRLLPQLRRDLGAAVKDRRIVLASSHPEARVPGLAPRHTHAVTGFDAERDVVRLWDPRGREHAPAGEPGPVHGYATSGGCFDIPLTRFFEHFRLVAFETAEPLRR